MLDRPLIDALHDQGFRIAVQTNGTLKASEGIDWICVSPKSTAPLNQESGHALKLVIRRLMPPTSGLGYPERLTASQPPSGAVSALPGNHALRLRAKPLRTEHHRVTGL
jgi:organic radical activating enzyme